MCELAPNTLQAVLVDRYRRPEADVGEQDQDDAVDVDEQPRPIGEVAPVAR